MNKTQRNSNRLNAEKLRAKVEHREVDYWIGFNFEDPKYYQNNRRFYERK